MELTTQNSKLKTHVIGLMSGTSVDAVDVALCRFEEDAEKPGDIELTVLAYAEQPYPVEVRAKVFNAFEGEATPADLTELNFELGAVFAEAVSKTLQSSGFGAEQLDLIASHGQTIYHQVAAGHTRSTLQMAESSVMAARTGVTVASDFRTADIALGGQGAPLVPYFDWLFFRDESRNRALQNIGGIGNVTFIPAGATAADVLAFDTGPGNSLLDGAMRHFSQGRQLFDQDGATARQGGIHPGWLDELLSHPYFEMPAPKSTGRESFGDSYVRQAIKRAEFLGLDQADTLATLTAFTAKSIATSLRRFNPGGRLDELIISGGGARNPVLMEMLGEWLPGVRVIPHDDFGIVAEAKEAVAFALLGYELLRNRPANLPGCTGASRPTLLGKLTPGQNYAALLQRFAPLMTAGYKLEEKDSWPTMPRLRLHPA